MGIGRALRRLTGVSERLLDDVPSEKPRYTGMGWAMLGTASMATIGMGLLISVISDLGIEAIVPMALGWGLFILGIDYSIVSYVDTTRGLAAAQQVINEEIEVPTLAQTGGRGRLAVRLVLALALGLAIGESLVLAAFGSQSTEKLDEERLEDLRTELCRTDLKLGEFDPNVRLSPECGDLLDIELPAADPIVDPATSEGGERSVDPELAAAYARLEEVDADLERFADLGQCERFPERFSPQRIAELSCSGVPGNGGAAAEADRNAARSQEEKNQLGTRIAALEAAASQRQATTTEAAAAQQLKDAADAEAALNSETAEVLRTQKNDLEQQVRDIQNGIRPEYGLNERFEATEEVVNPVILWGVRILFVLVEMTPVLIKMTLGVSVVDQMVALRRRVAIYPYLQEVSAVHEAYQEGAEVRQYMRDDPDAHRRQWGWVIDAARDRVVGWVDSERKSATASPEDPSSVPTMEQENRDATNEAEPDADIRKTPKRTMGGADAQQDGLVLIENKAFYVQDQIGEGNYAALKTVRPTNPDSDHSSIPLVVKQPFKGKLAQESIAREINVYREARASRYLPHFVAGDSKGIVMRYYPRTSIDRWFFSRHSVADYSYLDIQQWLSQLVDALLDLWEVDFGHGDGKPGNILITGPTSNMPAEYDGNGAVHEGHNEFRLVDFGSSVRLNKRVPTFSPGYAPPDALRVGEYLATPLSDIFSFLGGTLYYLVSGGVDPWFDQVEHHKPTRIEGSGIIADWQWKKFTQQWIDANRTQPITDLSVLNPKAPDPVTTLASIWLDPDPNRRLVHPANPDALVEAWQINTSWQLENIRQRLHQQIEWMVHGLQKHFGPQLVDVSVVEGRHSLARDPDEVPDLTTDEPASGMS